MVPLLDGSPIGRDVGVADLAAWCPAAASASSIGPGPGEAMLGMIRDGTTATACRAGNRLEGLVADEQTRCRSRMGDESRRQEGHRV